MKPADETAMLRFASGEMDADEESTFLARCEITPDSWRETVLAIAEHRRLVEALREVAAADTESPPAVGHTRRRPHPWRSVPVVVAAALVAGLLLGSIGTRMAGRDDRSDSLLVRTPPIAQGPLPPVGPAPEAALSILADVLRMQPLIPEARRVALEDQGFQVDEEPTLYIIDTENGTRWAVPTQRTTLHYVKR